MESSSLRAQRISSSDRRILMFRRRQTNRWTRQNRASQNNMVNFKNCSKGVSVAEGSQLPSANKPTQCSLKRSRHIKLFEFSVDFFCATFGAVKILFHGAVKRTRRLLSIFHQCDELGDCQSGEACAGLLSRNRNRTCEKNSTGGNDQSQHQRISETTSIAVSY